ncbi:MAG: sensor histidine kinase [Blastocatellia bacterium]|nr:sensor histidine kinase [Blastocatellia bacterium]
MDTNSLNIVSSRNRSYISIIIGATIVLVTILHFLTPTDQIVWHEIYQRLYYIPIIAAALLFGLRGGLAASIFTTVIYSPHIYLHWQRGHFDYSINQYAEIVIFNLVGGIMGALGDRLRLARERAELSAEQRQHAYDELQDTFQQLLQAEKLTSLGELSAGIVHEVRNPLASIKGAIEILQDELDADSPRREFAEIAVKEIERLDKMVGEYLRFAQPGKLAVEPSNINDIVDSVAALIKNQALSKGILIEKELDDTIPKLSIDTEQIRQVLLNLAINALQAVSGGGRITFITKKKNDLCVVEVEDSGEGISQANLAKIFDPFFTTKEKGVGLGLSIAHKIINEHGGQLTAFNQTTGTVLQICLPLQAKIGLIETS